MQRAPLLLLLLSTACVNTPDIYAPPTQRKPFVLEAPGPLKHFIAMDDPAAPAHLMMDVNERVEAGGGRWTGKRPVLRFRVPTRKHLKLVMDFSFHEVVLKNTGPITVRFAVNNHVLDTVRYEKDGGHHFEKAIDPSWIHPNGDVLVALELNRIFVAPDGARFGLMLQRAGLLD